MTKAKFYNFITDDGVRMININNIASIEDIGNEGIRVTLDTKLEKDINVSFIANLPWPQVTGEIKNMSERK